MSVTDRGSRRVLLTGAGGYIGQVLGPLLVQRGWEVVGCDAGYFDGCDLPGGRLFGVDWVADVRDLSAADLRGFAAVVHLAGLSNDPLGELNPGLTEDINYHASVRLAEQARAAGVERFVFSSSCSVYGASSARPVTEDDPLDPLTAYASSKIMTEQAVMPLASDSFCPVFLRNATVYGLSPRLRFDLVVNNLSGWAFTTGQIKIMSDGSPWRPLIHVQDVSLAFAAALDAPAEAVRNQSFNVGADRDNYTVRDIAVEVQKIFPTADLSLSTTPPADSRSYRVDFSKVRTMLPQFRPSWSLARGIAELRDAFAACALTAEQFEGPRYTRLKHIQQLLATGELDGHLRLAKQPVAVGGALSGVPQFGGAAA